MSVETDTHVVHVHVDNSEDMRVVKTEEHEPEHFICGTELLAAGEVQQLFNLDLDRKSFTVYSNDGQLIVAHSQAQAGSAANKVTGLPAPDGTLLAQGQPLSGDGTGPLWVVNPSSSVSIRVSHFQNKRGM